MSNGQVVRLLMGAVVGSSAVLVALLGVNDSPAFAHASRSCLGSGDYGAINDHQIDANTSTNRGTRASMRVIDVNGVNCQHVGSVYAANPSSYAGVEFAYLIGYSNCAAGGTIYYPTPTPSSGLRTPRVAPSGVNFSKIGFRMRRIMSFGCRI